MNPHRIIIVPGWRNSGPDHWQSLWAQQLPHAERVEQDDWLVPHRDPWVAALEQLVLSRPEPVVLAAHSLGCITAAHLGPEASARVRGALLVAPADPERRCRTAACWWPAATTPTVRSAGPAPMRGPGEASSCGCRTRGTSMSNRALATGPWAWRCCSR